MMISNVQKVSMNTIANTYHHKQFIKVKTLDDNFFESSSSLELQSSE